MTILQRILLLVLMLLMHIIADYNLQGVLASMKQRSWWKAEFNGRLPNFYRNDYKIALMTHAFMWSVLISVPPLWIVFSTENACLGWILLASYALNTIVHAYVDDAKANRKKINLATDQLMHLIQIVFTWIIINAAI